MSDTNENTQPMKASEPVDTGDPNATQEMKPAKEKKPRRFLGFLINALLVLLIIGLGVFGGYQSGIGIRKNTQKSLITQQLTDQYARALVDIQFGNYSAAQQRLEYVLKLDPTFPGAMEKLTEVMVISNVPTVTPVFSPTPQLIVDDTDYEGLFAQAQQLVAAGQWENAIVVLGTLRLKDATFRTTQVDGMYYFALRNLGVDFIKAGNLEGGIYELSLAERFAPLDNIAYILRDSARAYINAASFWDLDWKRAAEGFYYLNGSGVWDGTMTATERYRIAAMRYGDQLFGQQQYCDAYEWYQYAQTAGNLDNEAAKNANQAYQACYPPTGTPAPTVIATQPPATQPPATQPPATQPPVVQPTATTQPQPTQPPPTEAPTTPPP